MLSLAEYTSEQTYETGQFAQRDIIFSLMLSLKNLYHPYLQKVGADGVSNGNNICLPFGKNSYIIKKYVKRLPRVS